MEALQKLQQMIGNTYEFECTKYTIFDVRVKGNIATLKTDKENIELPIDGLDDYLHEFKLKGANMIIKSPDIIDMITRSGCMYTDLQATLLKTIEKVESDSKYIPQAQAINETMKQLIDLEKVKIQTISLLKG